MFKGEYSKFTEWLRKTTGSPIAADGSAFRPVTEWVEDQDNVNTNEALDRQLCPVGADAIEDVQDKGDQVHVALLALTESESFDVVFWSGTIRSGSVETIGPSSGSSGWKSAELYHNKSWFQIDASCKTFPQALRNEKNWPADTKGANRVERRQQLDDEIKTAALEALVPGESEPHLAMNRARLITYEQVRSEIQAYVEARRSQFGTPHSCVEDHFQIRWTWTAWAREASRARKEKK